MKFVQNLASITRSHSPLSRYRFEKEKNIFRKTLYTPVIELYPCHTKSLVQFGPFPWEHLRRCLPSLNRRKKLLNHQLLGQKFPDCLEIWQAGALWDPGDRWGILKIYFRSNSRWRTAGRSAKASVFDHTQISAAIVSRWSKICELKQGPFALMNVFVVPTFGLVQSRLLWGSVGRHWNNRKNARLCWHLIRWCIVRMYVPAGRCGCAMGPQSSRSDLSPLTVKFRLGSAPKCSVLKSLEIIDRFRWNFFPRCMECQRGLAIRKLSVCLSVCLSNA